MKMIVVSASLSPEKTFDFWSSWWKRSGQPIKWEMVWVHPHAMAGQGRATQVVTGGIVGVVPAFAAGVRKAKEMGADIIACFHDDLRIDEDGWDTQVVKLFAEKPRCGLAGFFGAKSLGASDIYASDYSPMQLARGECGSNMLEAEKHGERWVVPTRVACFDGFSQIGRADFMVKAYDKLEKLGVIHHAYDSAIGAMAIRDGYECWMLPIKCHHAGGMTAVGSAEYNEWAKKKGGDQEIWKKSHQILYEELRDVLPLSVGD